MRTRTDGMLPAERKVLDDVDEYGVHVVHVPAEGDGPGFSFTVGLWHSFEQPEVIVFGLEDELAADLLNAIADEASEDRKYLDGTRHDDVLVGYPVRFVAVPRERYRDFLGLAIWAHESDAFPCVQLVYPDKQGRWPWDTGVREGFAAAQPVLGRRPS
jgi:hypothetical protein